MPRSRTRPPLVACLVLAASAVLAACGSGGSVSKTTGLAGQVPKKAEPGTFVLGTQPWIGYGIYTIAAKRGLFAREGLKVKTVNFTSDKDANAAIASGRVDGMNVGITQAFRYAEAGLPIKIVMLEDQSQTADGILSQPSITSLRDLKGKSVASEVGSVTDMELTYALSTVGLTDKDVKKVDIAAVDSGSAVIAGKVAAAVTYEPYITAGKGKGLKLLWTAGQKPGLVGDALVVRQDVMKKKPGEVEAMLRAWQDGLDYYKQHTTDARAIISTDLGSKPSELDPSFNGISFYSVPESRTALTGGYAQTLKLVNDAATKAGIIQSGLDPNRMVAPRFVKAFGSAG